MAQGLPIVSFVWLVWFGIKRHYCPVTRADQSVCLSFAVGLYRSRGGPPTRRANAAALHFTSTSLQSVRSSSAWPIARPSHHHPLPVTPKVNHGVTVLGVLALRGLAPGDLGRGSPRHLTSSSFTTTTHPPPSSTHARTAPPKSRLQGSHHHSPAIHWARGSRQPFARARRLAAGSIQFQFNGHHQTLPSHQQQSPGSTTTTIGKYTHARELALNGSSFSSSYHIIESPPSSLRLSPGSSSPSTYTSSLDPGHLQPAAAAAVIIIWPWAPAGTRT